MNFKKRLWLGSGASGGDTSRLFLQGHRRAPPRPRLVASGRTRFVSRSCTRATLFIVSPRDSTRTPARKAELVKHAAASARGCLPRAVARRAPLLEARATAVAPAAAPARAPGSIQHRGRYAPEGSPASPPLARSPQPFSNRRRARRFATGKQSAFSNSLLSTRAARLPRTARRENRRSDSSRSRIHTPVAPRVHRTSSHARIPHTSPRSLARHRANHAPARLGGAVSAVAAKPKAQRLPPRVEDGWCGPGKRSAPRAPCSARWCSTPRSPGTRRFSPTPPTPASLCSSPAPRSATWASTWRTWRARRRTWGACWCATCPSTSATTAPPWTSARTWSSRTWWASPTSTRAPSRGACATPGV